MWQCPYRTVQQLNALPFAANTIEYRGSLFRRTSEIHVFNQTFSLAHYSDSPPFENQLPDDWEETVELQTNLMNNLPETLFKWVLWLLGVCRHVEIWCQIICDICDSLGFNHRMPCLFLFSDFTDFLILITSFWEFIIWLLFAEVLGTQNIDNVIKAVLSLCI